MLSWKDERLVTLLSRNDSTGPTAKTRCLRGDELNTENAKVVDNYIDCMGVVD